MLLTFYCPAIRHKAGYNPGRCQLLDCTLRGDLLLKLELLLLKGFMLSLAHHHKGLKTLFSAVGGDAREQCGSLFHRMGQVFSVIREKERDEEHPLLMKGEMSHPAMGHGATECSEFNILIREFHSTINQVSKNMKSEIPYKQSGYLQFNTDF
jgi:hypothetical protein